MIRILVVDDHEVVRAGMVALIQTEPDLHVVGQARTGEEAERLYRDLCPDVVVMDLKMPGAGGRSAIESLRRISNKARILVVSSLIGDEPIHASFQAGALGFLTKDMEGDALTDAIRSTYAGIRTVPPEVGAALADRVSYAPLTARELDVLRGVCVGKSNQEIAEALKVSESSIKAQLKSIAVKLNTPDRTAAAVLALKRGLLELDEI